MCWSCSHPEHVPCQGSRECHWVIPLVFDLGNRLCYLRAGSLCWLLPEAARCCHLPWAVLWHPSPAALCWLCLWEGAVLREGCLDPWCHENLSRCWQGAQCWSETSWFGVSLCLTDRAAAMQSPGRTDSRLFRDRAQLPFLLSHTVFPTEPCDVGCQC